MSLQDIRHYYEQPIVDWCAANGVELRAANMVEPNSDAAGEFVVTSLNFGNFHRTDIVRRHRKRAWVSCRGFLFA